MKRMALCSAVITLGLVLMLTAPAVAQQANQNIPVLPVIPEEDDPLWNLKGDGYLQRQVEPTIAVSTRNPNHLLSFFVDYRAVDVADDVGLGKTIDEIVSEMNMVAEGVKSTRGILALADRFEIEMPIAEQVGRVLYDNASVPEAIAILMGRSAKPGMMMNATSP